MESRISQLENLEKPDTDDFEAIGWLKVQGTSLDMPIMRSEIDDYAFPVEYDNYVWTLNEKLPDNNLIILTGHNIFNLSSNPTLKSDLFTRFEELMSFVYYDFAKDNKYFQVTLNGEEYIYKIFAVDFISYVDFLKLPSENKHTDKEFKEYIQYLKENSLYDYDIDVNENDKVVSLITCTRFYGSQQRMEFYVTGRLVRKNERLNNYKVTKNKNYEEVEKIMKDGETNEEEV